AEIYADPALVERILANLLSNALRHSPPDQPPMISASEHAGTVEIRVIDHGPGISAADRDRVFLPFQRLGDRGNATGVGLGLALSRGLAEAMGGSLDLGLPDIDGVDVIRSLRTWTPVPIVVLSGRAHSHDKVDALDAGADDYVTKPFNVDELLARIRAATRRVTTADTTPPARIGRYTIDLAARTATDGAGTQVHLTRTEWQLLDVLVRNPGKLVSQRQLLQEVWGPTY